MRQQRVRLVINVGNLLEILGAAAAVYGVGRLAGLGFALVLAGILAVAAAELIFTGHTWHVPLPHRPHPRRRLKERRQRTRAWWMRRARAWRRWRTDRRDRAWAGKATP